MCASGAFAGGFCPLLARNRLNFGWNKLSYRLGLRYFLVQLHSCAYWNGQVGKVQFGGVEGSLFSSTALVSLYALIEPLLKQAVFSKAQS